MSRRTGELAARLAREAPDGHVVASGRERVYLRGLFRWRLGLRLQAPPPGSIAAVRQQALREYADARLAEESS